MSIKSKELEDKSIEILNESYNNTYQMRKYKQLDLLEPAELVIVSKSYGKKETITSIR